MTSPITGAIGVEAIGVTKRFGAFTALDGVSLTIAPATVHGLLGENGAGKSTLAKCLLGYYRADEGRFLVDGREQAIARPADASALGLGMVYQHRSLVTSMTVSENFVMAGGAVPAVINWPRERARLEGFMAQAPFRVPMGAVVADLSTGERQKAEILKQLYLRRRLLVLDEPTAALTPGEAEDVLSLLRGLAQAGQVTVVLITHKLREVARFTDEVTVLRRGRVAGGGAIGALSANDMTTLAIGEPHVPRCDRRGEADAAPRLLIRALTTQGDRGLRLQEVRVRAHEIVAVAGVSGNGQTELLEVLAGQRARTGGEIVVSGEDYAASREQAHRLRVRVLPDEPLRRACVPDMSVNDNLNLRAFDRTASGHRGVWLDRSGMAARARRLMREYGVRAPSPAAPMSVLSGGNVQRCVLARELDGDVHVLIVANPCRGLDSRAVAAMRARLMTARNDGTAVLLLSEDLDEILELADRILVMRGGRIVHDTPAEGTDARSLGAYMLGA